MNYPVWELAMGGGVLIAGISILHVFISHFAVGGGLWLVITERRAYRQQDDDLLAFVKRHSRFFMLVTLVLGAITGVGIWFSIALVSPQAVSALIHAYVWGWAMEWVLFFVEIAAALVYFYGWDKLDRKTHQAIGWIYFIAAWGSLVVINGIITFMLTPGTWLETKQFWHGFFNPTYFPSLVMRTFICFALAGIFTLLTAARLPRTGFRRRVTRYNATWVIVATVLAAAAGFWYRAAFPGWSDLVRGAVPVLPTLVTLLQIGVLAVLILGLWPLLAPKRWNAVGVVLLAAAGLMAFGSAEWLREAGRKPFTIKNYLYSTGMRVDEAEKLTQDGMMAHTRWINTDVGHDQTAIGKELYRAHCQPCHTMDGYNGLRPFLVHWNQKTVTSLIPRLEHLRALMPPWFGDSFENGCLAQYLLSEGEHGQRAFPENRAKAERLAWDLSCGLCHTVDGFRPLREALADQSPEELDELLDMVGDLTEEMPPYHGDQQQRELLMAYLARVAGSAAAGGGNTNAAALDVERAGAMLAERSEP